MAIDPSNPSTTPLAQSRINDQLPTDQNVIGDGLFGFDIIGFSEDASGNLYVIQFDGDIHKLSKNLPGTHTVFAVAGTTVSDIDFYIDGVLAFCVDHTCASSSYPSLQDMIHIADTKVARRYGDYFLRQINKLQDVNQTLSR